MLDFEVQKFTRVCAVTERELNPGDPFFSYLLREGGTTQRRDVAADAWDGPPEDCLAWWKSEVPDPKSKKLHWAPDDVILHCFADTESDPSKTDLRYVLSLLMIRRRIFRLENTETDERGQQIMTVYCPRNETQYDVAVVDVSEEQAKQSQTLISQLLVDTGSK